MPICITKVEAKSILQCNEVHVRQIIEDSIKDFRRKGAKWTFVAIDLAFELEPPF